MQTNLLYFTKHNYDTSNIDEIKKKKQEKQFSWLWNYEFMSQNNIFCQKVCYSNLKRIRESYRPFSKFKHALWNIFQISN